MRVLSAILLSSFALLAQAGGEHGVSAGPLTALRSFPAAAEFAARQAETPAVSVQAQQWITAEGLRVLFRPDDALPMLDVRLVFDAGSARDGELYGLASAVSSLMDEGTRRRDASQLAEGFEQVGAQFSASSLRDMALLQLRVLSDPARRDPALDLFAEAAAEPAFNGADWARLQESLRVGQRQRLQAPGGRASLLFFQHLYGDHPYAHPSSGLPSTLARITPQELRAFHQRYYSAGNAVLVLVGQLTRAEAEVIASRLGQRLPAGAAAEALPAVPPLKRARRVTQAFAAQQTHVILGEIGIRRGDPDQFPLMVANELLGGGGFGTLLMRELREKRGLTYSVSSSFQPMREAGPFQISFSTRADQAEDALRLTRQLLADFVRNGADADAVRQAIANLTQAFPRSVASNADIAAQLGSMGFYGLPEDYLSGYVARLQAVTPEQVRAALARHIHPDRLLVITVGPEAGTRPATPAARKP